MMRHEVAIRVLAECVARGHERERRRQFVFIMDYLYSHSPSENMRVCVRGNTLPELNDL